MRGGWQPTLVKVELEEFQGKVAVLRSKSKLNDSDTYGRLFLASTKWRVI